MLSVTQKERFFLNMENFGKILAATLFLCEAIRIWILRFPSPEKNGERQQTPNQAIVFQIPGRDFI